MTLPRGIRNHNPGNIERGKVRWAGEVDGTDPRFATFEAPIFGIRALCALLRIYWTRHRLSTVRAIINRWAPPKENNTSAYVERVARDLGVSVDYALDMDDWRRIAQLADAIIAHECGPNPARADRRWYDRDLVDRAARLAFGIVEPDPVATPAPVPVPEPDGWGAPVSPSPAPATPEPAPSVAPDAGAATTSSPPPQEPSRMGTASLVLAFLPQLMQWVPSLVRLFGSPGSATTERNAKAAEVLGEILKGVAGADTVEGSVAKIASAPELQAQLREEVHQRWETLVGIVRDLTEIEDGSRDRAAARAKGEAWDMGRFIVHVQAWSMGMVTLGLAAMLVVDYVADKAFDPAVLALCGPLLGGAIMSWRSLVEYRFGSSESSRLKDAALAEAATKGAGR